MNDVFINSALNNALYNYKSIKELGNKPNDFLTYVVGLLCYIYGEENILDLYNKNDSKSFTYLLEKYNVDSYYVEKFYEDIMQFSLVDEMQKNPYFMYIQEDLINMYIAKYYSLGFNKKKLLEFKELLFTPESNIENMVHVNEMLATNKNYISSYFDAKMYQIDNKIDFTMERDNLLSNEVYAHFGLDEEKLSKLSTTDIESINNKILSLFHLNPIDPNLNKKLLDCIEKSDPKKLSVKITNNSKMTNVAFFVIIFVICIAIALIMLMISVKGK